MDAYFQLFSGIKAESLENLLDAALLQQFPTGVVLIYEGQPADFLHVLVAGVRAIFDQDVAFARIVARELALVYRSSVKKLKGYMARSSVERLANWILTEAQRDPDQPNIVVPFDRGTLASHIGTTRESLSQLGAADRPWRAHPRTRDRNRPQGTAGSVCTAAAIYRRSYVVNVVPAVEKLALRQTALRCRSIGP